jgi:hypothetical protein
MIARVLSYLYTYVLFWLDFVNPIHAVRFIHKQTKYHHPPPPRRDKQNKDHKDHKQNKEHNNNDSNNDKHTDKQSTRKRHKKSHHDDKKYDPLLAARLAHLCFVIYNREELHSWLRRQRRHIQLVKLFDNDEYNITAMILKERLRRGKYNIYVIVCGSTCYSDYHIIDCQTKLIRIGGGYRVHQGVLEATESVLRILELYLHRYHKQIETCYFAGHDIGGSHACILAHFLRHYSKHKRTRMQLYTFGSPFPGNRHFLRQVNRIPNYWIQNIHDPVPYTWIENTHERYTLPTRVIQYKKRKQIKRCSYYLDKWKSLFDIREYMQHWYHDMYMGINASTSLLFKWCKYEEPCE